MNTYHSDLHDLSRVLPKGSGGPLGHHDFDGDDPSWAVVAKEMIQPVAPRAESPAASDDPPCNRSQMEGFFPRIAKSFRDTGLRESHIESLVLKYLLNTGLASGREIGEQLGLPFGMIERLLHSMKMQQLLVIKSDAPLGDFAFELTEFGNDRARRFAQQCTYFGAAPVPLDQYAQSVAAQTVQGQKLTIERIRQAFRQLVLSDQLLGQLGEAINMGRGMFLHGMAGNGKSTIAERLIAAYSPTIWIPPQSWSAAKLSDCSTRSIMKSSNSTARENSTRNCSIGAGCTSADR